MDVGGPAALLESRPTIRSLQPSYMDHNPSADELILQAIEPVQNDAGPSTVPAPAPGAAKKSHNKPKPKKSDKLVAYTTAHVPGGYNIKNPAGDFMQKESNVEVIRQMTLETRRREKVARDEEKKRLVEGGQQVPESTPLSNILIIHPGSRNLRVGRASDYYPKEIPNCIARPAKASQSAEGEEGNGRSAKRAKLNNGENVDGRDTQHSAGTGDAVDKRMKYLRDYLRERLRVNKLATDYREGTRVQAANARARPEPIPEHNDPYRFDWTEVKPDKDWYIGTEALRIPQSTGYKVRYPFSRRAPNRHDWRSYQGLVDDIELILRESLKTELGISPRDYPNYSVVLIIPDHGDRPDVQLMTDLLLEIMGFKEIAIQQESYCALFSSGMSSACIVDIGSSQTTVACVDEGTMIQESRIKLNYGSDDITTQLHSFLMKANFPYHDVNLSRAQDWLLMDNLKIKICTLEEHLVASTAWDFVRLREDGGLTEKYIFRTYDENILAPLCFFDSRVIDFDEKNDRPSLPHRDGESEGVTDQITTEYDQPTVAMKLCTVHLVDPEPQAPAITVEPAEEVSLQNSHAPSINAGVSANGGGGGGLETPRTTSPAKSDTSLPVQLNGVNGVSGPVTVTAVAEPAQPAIALGLSLLPRNYPDVPDFDIVEEAAKSPLDAAIVASLMTAPSEAKARALALVILVVGGGAATKGLNAFIEPRIAHLLSTRGIVNASVRMVALPRSLNPRFVSWKGAAVMCNLESLNDMWISREEWVAQGPKALKDRLLFL